MTQHRTLNQQLENYDAICKAAQRFFDGETTGDEFINAVMKILTFELKQ